MPEGAPLSCYVLTLDSERRLAQVLDSVSGVSDDLLVVDSGSRDRTLQIAKEAGARVVYREFDNFRDQRQYAISLCRHDWVLELDSDEVVSPSLRGRLLSLKACDFAPSGSPPDAFGIRREWYMLGKPVHCFYPSKCPDQPLRLYQKAKVAYGSSKIIHEAPGGHRTAQLIREPILHYTCDTLDDMYAKINRYSTLLALDMHRNGERSSWFKIVVYPWLLWLKFYVIRGGWHDGRLGLIHGRYVRDVVWQKYVKLMYDIEGPGGRAGARK